MHKKSKDNFNKTIYYHDCKNNLFIQETKISTNIEVISHQVNNIVASEYFK